MTRVTCWTYYFRIGKRWIKIPYWISRRFTGYNACAMAKESK